jgi:hypothetical protein
MPNSSKWDVTLAGQAKKAPRDLPKKTALAFFALLEDLERSGPNQPTWPHYSKLKDAIYHCHIERGRPTYVACWRADKKQKSIEVYYAGTHEKAPY